MSITSAMLAGVSGLVANSSALAAISDNIANVNTVGYKRNAVNFSNAVTSQAAAGRYAAGGVQGVTHQFIGQQGLLQSSSSTTDLALSGDGFFVVTTKGDDLNPADARMFTRAGSFTVDADGYLVNSGGFFLQGWLPKPDGTFDINPSDLNKMSAINARAVAAAVSPTTEIELSANVNKAQLISADEATYNGATVDSMSDYSANPATGTKPDFTMEMTVYDSTGGSHKLALSMLRSDANPNEWHAEIHAIPAADITGTGRPGQLARGLLNFNPDGSVNMATSTLFGAAGAASTITLAASGGAAPKWSDAQGLAAQTIQLDFSALSQYAAASTVNSISGNGASVGSVVGVEVGADGIVTAIYDNSQTRQIAKIGVATFPNADGLTAISGNAYRTSSASGGLVIKEAGVGGAGKIAPSSLEASTVDLSAEFTGLIATQKAYSASSKIITTADQMLEELINIKR